MSPLRRPGRRRRRRSSERVADPRRRVRQGPAAALREGDARALRERPPAMGAEASLRRAADGTIAELDERRGRRDPHRRRRRHGLQRKYTKKGDLMAVFVLEDLQAAVEVMVFPKTMQRARPQARRRRHRLRQGPPRQAGRDPEAHRHGDRARSSAVAEAAPPLRLNLPAAVLSEERIDRPQGACWASIPGESPVFLHLGERKVLRLPDEHRRGPAPAGGRAAGRFGPRSRRPVADALSSSGHTSWGALFRTPSGDGKMVTRRSSEPAALHRRTCRDAPGA